MVGGSNPSGYNFSLLLVFRGPAWQLGDKKQASAYIASNQNRLTNGQQMHRLAVGLAGIAMFAAPTAAQQQWPDIFQIVDQFMVSNVIASKCVKPAPDKLVKFLANFQIVTTTASVEMKKIRPELSSEQVEEIWKKRYSEIDDRISRVVEKETCNGPKVMEALRRFDAQADMNLLDQK